jgi:hypothetical protein
VEQYKNASITDGVFGRHKKKLPKKVFFQRMLFLDGYQGRGGGYLCTVTYRHIIVSWKIAYKSGFFYAALGREGHYQCVPSILSDVKMDDGTYDQLLILMSLDHQSPLSVREKP